MTKRVVSSSPQASLVDVQRLLAEEGVTRIVVVDSIGNPEGIVSEKDVIRFVIDDET
jgi:CBS domain-containing protein